MILLDDVTRMFGEVRALDGFDLEVDRGEVFGLLSHNGAGKTTTLRLIAGLIAATRGSVRVDGLDPHLEGQIVRSHLGVLPANAAVDDQLTGRDNLRLRTGVTTPIVAAHGVRYGRLRPSRERSSSVSSG